MAKEYGVQQSTFGHRDYTECSFWRNEKSVPPTALMYDNIWTAAWQNQQNDLCAQQRLGSAWASSQSVSLRCLHEESFGP